MATLPQMHPETNHYATFGGTEISQILCNIKGTPEKEIMVWTTVHPEQVTCDKCIEELRYITSQVMSKGIHD